MSTGETIRRLGLTNSNIGFTMGELISQRYIFKGVCFEPGCEYTTDIKSINNCPNCKRALYWKKSKIRG